MAAGRRDGDDGVDFLFCGLGGGLDVMNAALFAAAAERAGKRYRLGAIRPVPQSELENFEAFADSGCEMTAASKVLRKGRYAEPVLAGLMQQKVFFFSREYQGKVDLKRLVEALAACIKKFRIRNVFLVDGGGDSLTLVKEDAISVSEHADPFKGGDAEALRAVQALCAGSTHAMYGECRLFLVPIAVGLDVNRTNFLKHCEALKATGGSYGAVDLRTGEGSGYELDHLLPLLRVSPELLPRWFHLAEQLLVREQADVDNPNKLMSMTATVSYYALKADYGQHRTFVPWEPVIDGKPGPIVEAHHSFAYFLDPKQVEDLKCKYNNREPYTIA